MFVDVPVVASELLNVSCFVLSAMLYIANSASPNVTCGVTIALIDCQVAVVELVAMSTCPVVGAADA